MTGRCGVWGEWGGICRLFGKTGFDRRMAMGHCPPASPKAVSGHVHVSFFITRHIEAQITAGGSSNPTFSVSFYRSSICCTR